MIFSNCFHLQRSPGTIFTGREGKTVVSDRDLAERTGRKTNIASSPKMPVIDGRIETICGPSLPCSGSRGLTAGLKQRPDGTKKKRESTGQPRAQRRQMVVFQEAT
jgi:hypothetical protein